MASFLLFLLVKMNEQEVIKNKEIFALYSELSLNLLIVKLDIIASYTYWDMLGMFRDLLPKS